MEYLKSMSRRRKTVDLTDNQFTDLVQKVNKQSQAMKPKSVSFKNKKQLQYYNTIMENQITVATGVAGTAKTFIAAYAGLSLLASNEIERIIVTKPSVEIGKTQGFLPGNLEEKMEPFTRSVINCFEQLIGEQQTNNLIYSKKQVEIIPLQMMRGLTLDNCFIIADEMQNADYGQIKALLTRLGEDSVLVMNGDCDQTDLKEHSGLPSAIEILKEIEGVGFVEFTIDDIVRSGIVKDIIISYYNYEKNK
jgi:phosphate starvation-inducible PhoH-like protein